MIPMELEFLSICYFYIHFHLTPTMEVNKMYEIWKKWPPELQYLIMI